MRTCRWVVVACILLGVGGIGPFEGCEGRDGVVGSIVVGWRIVSFWLGRRDRWRDG